MRDIELKSVVMDVNGWPGGTKKVMLMYDGRGWAIRCYDEDGNKLTTLVMDTRKDQRHEKIMTLVRENLI